MTVDLYEEIGTRIRHAREGKRWTQEYLGTQMTPTRSHAAVSDIERGRTHLDVNELVALADLLGVATKDLLGSLSVTAYFPPNGLDPPPTMKRTPFGLYSTPDPTAPSYVPGAGWVVVLEGLPAGGMATPPVVVLPVVAFMFMGYAGYGVPLVVTDSGTVGYAPGDRVLAVCALPGVVIAPGHGAEYFDSALIRRWREAKQARAAAETERRVRAWAPPTMDPAQW